MKKHQLKSNGGSKKLINSDSSYRTPPAKINKSNITDSDPKQWLGPVIKKYLRLKTDLCESISKSGQIPRNICEICSTTNCRQFVDKLTSKETKIAEIIAKK